MRCRAFTLIEILVVLGMILLLAALIFPVFNRARESARRSSCLSNQRQVVAAMQMYVQDNAHLSPQSTDLGWDSYQPYAKTKTIFHCPSAYQNGIFLNYLARRGLGSSSLIPEAQTVVVYCQQHLLEGSDYPPNVADNSGTYLPGLWLVAHWDGSAKVIQGSQTRDWFFQNGKWQKLLPGTTVGTDAVLETRFPDEEWPLQFQ